MIKFIVSSLPPAWYFNPASFFLLSIRPTRRNILFPVSRPTHFFSKKAKKKKKGGVVFRWLVAATPFFFATPVSFKEGWAWPRHSTPTDRPARDSRDTGVGAIWGPPRYGAPRPHITRDMGPPGGPQSASILGLPQ